MIEEAAGLNAAYGGRNPTHGVGHRKYPEDFRSLYHGVGEGKGIRQRGKQRKQRRQQSQRGGRGREDDGNKATAETLSTISDNCNNVLAFLHAIAVKTPQVIADPLSLHAEKRVRIWFRCWIDSNLPTPTRPSPQDHMGLMGVLKNMATRLHTT